MAACHFAMHSPVIFALRLGINQEYFSDNHRIENTNLRSARRSLTRFIAIVNVALVLQGLIRASNTVSWNGQANWLITLKPLLRCQYSY